MKEDKVILDCSAVINLLGLNGQKGRLAVVEQLDIDTVITAPTILYYEIGNTVSRLKNINPIEVYQLLALLNIVYIDLLDLSEDIVSIAKKNQLSFYDASYVFLLNSDNGISKLITFDRDFLKVGSKKVKCLA